MTTQKSRPANISKLQRPLQNRAIQQQQKKIYRHRETRAQFSVLASEG